MNATQKKHSSLGNFSVLNYGKQKYTKYAILFVLFMMQAIGYGVAQNIQPLFVYPVSKTIFNDSLTLFLLVFTISAIFSSLSQPILAKLYGKVNTKLLFSIGSIVSGLFMVLSGFTYFLYKDGVPEGGYATYLYIIQIFVQIGCLLYSGLGIPFIVGAWFPGKNRGTALGFCMAGGSVGNFMWQPVVSEALNSNILKIDGIDGTQWVSCYFLFGGISIGFMLIMTFLFISNPTFVHTTIQTDKDKLETSIARDGPGFRYIMRFPLFWMVLLGYCFFAFGICSFTTQYGSYLQRGLSWYTNQNLYYLIGITGTFYAIGCLFGNFFGGVIFSKTSTFTGFTVAGIMRIVGSLMFFASILIPWFAPIGAAVIGFSCYTYTSGPAFMSTALFGRKDNLRIMGIIGIGFAVGYAVSNPIYGAIIGDIKIKHEIYGQPVYGDWQTLLIVGILSLGVGLIIMLFAIFYIQKMGLIGIYNYSNSKYSNIIRMHGLKIWLDSFLIWVFKDDYRTSQKYINKYNKKVNKYLNKNVSKNIKKNDIWHDNKIKEAQNNHDKMVRLLQNKLNSLDKLLSSKQNDKKLIKEKNKLNKKLVNQEDLLKYKLSNIEIAYNSLKDYYSNKYLHIEHLISERVFNRFEKHIIKNSNKINVEIIDINHEDERITKINDQWKGKLSICPFIENYDEKIQSKRDFLKNTLEKANV